MNADDILTRASNAVRERAREPSTEASRTRAQVLLRASRRAKRGKLAVSLAPLAAVFAISTAWASTHEGLPRAWDRVLGLFASNGGTSAPAGAGIAAPVVHPVAIATAAAPPDERESNPPAPPEVSIDALPQTSPPSLPWPAARRAEPVAPQGSARVVPETVREAVAQAHPAAPVAVAHEDDQARLYAEAHRAHFVDGDPSSALRAWNAYLAAAPEGTFAPEAHYNRAVTLVRLGRLAEARRELEPFARGAYGGYRTREAAALLDAIALRAR
ncbi:MAG TPA: hypothetical protein VK762_28975 [Polyangiaceae bacterium]|jgi:hypothetical protein|nr:hypothetical protein [Polyangiaceae bacterium]